MAGWVLRGTCVRGGVSGSEQKPRVGISVVSADGVPEAAFVPTQSVGDAGRGSVCGDVGGAGPEGAQRGAALRRPTPPALQQERAFASSGARELHTRPVAVTRAKKSVWESQGSCGRARRTF